MKAYRSILFSVCVTSFFIFTAGSLSAQISPSNTFSTFSVPFLNAAPDARSSGMGESGVALSPDANAIFWNAAKLVFTEKDFGASLSYAPKLAMQGDGKWMGHAGLYKNLGNRHAIAASVNDLDARQLTLPDGLDREYGFKSLDRAFSVAYASKLGKDFSVGVTLKYISSTLTSDNDFADILFKPGRTVAGDLSTYYRKEFVYDDKGRNLTWTLGTVLSNLGGSLYSDHIPTTFKLGSGLSFSPDDRSQFNFVFDVSKLVVLALLHDDFGDEMRQVRLSGGVEYRYKNAVALRSGYLYNNDYPHKRSKAFTAGAGIRLFKGYDIDFAYVFPANSNISRQTCRISLSVSLDTDGTAD